MSKHAIGVENASPLMPNSRTNHNSKAGGGGGRIGVLVYVQVGNHMIHNRLITLDYI